MDSITNHSITNLLRALAEAIRPYLGLDDNGGAAVVEAIEGLDDHIEEVVVRYNRANDIAPVGIEVEEAVETYMTNDSSILTDSSFDPDAYDLLTNDDFDPSNYGLLDESDISYLINQKVRDEVPGEVESWADDNLVGIDYTSDEFLDAVERAVRATLAGITFTVQANVTQPEVHLRSTEVHLSGDDVVAVGI